MMMRPTGEIWRILLGKVDEDVSGSELLADYVFTNSTCLCELLEHAF